VLDLEVKKWPSQERSRVTFDAIVTACAGLLPRLGYAGTTTNHIAERAGVNVASLYEYFPGKDAIVARVAEQLVERVLDRLGDAAIGVMQADEDAAVRCWIETIHETVARERELVAVFVYQVPYTNDLPSIASLGPRLVEFSQEIRRHAGGFVHPEFSAATLHLVVNLVTSTIMQLVLDPPRDVAGEELLDELVRRVEAWIRAPVARPPSR
jgi:AcrR family transcriptional regulator